MGVLLELRGVGPSNPPLPSRPGLAPGKLLEGIWNCRRLLLAETLLPTQLAVGRELDWPKRLYGERRDEHVNVLELIVSVVLSLVVYQFNVSFMDLSCCLSVCVYLLCGRYPAMSRRVFLGMDRNSLWTCCFHDNSLFFCVSVKDWRGVRRREGRTRSTNQG